ncbi:MAG TPA: endonuclease [Prolixibacteraceae bacterium]|nr:endonuclease [Prolixibacteraceae bacterium]
MKFTFYILQSQQDASFYIGYTTDLDRRLFEHNSGKSNYTSGKKPWKVVYSEKFETKTAAIKREKFLKNQRNRAFYEKLICDYQPQ